MGGRFSVERSTGNYTNSVPQQQQPFQQPYTVPDYNQPVSYGQPQMPQSYGMSQQMSPANWPTFFPKETIGIDRGVFMDDTQSILTPNDIRIIPGSLEGIRTIRLKGYKLVIFFNEPLIGQRKMTQQNVDVINQQLMNIFGQAGIFTIDGMLYATTNMKEDIYAMPNTGMLKKAENDMRLSFKNGYFVGDKIYNLKIADTMNVKPILIQTGNFSDTQTKLDSFANKELKNKVKTYSNLLEFANSLE